MRSILVAVLACSLTAYAGPKKKSAPVVVAPPPAVPATPYVGVLPTVSDSEEYAALLTHANELLKAEYDTYQLDYVPEGESDQVSADVVRAKKTEGVRLRLTLTAAREQMRASLMVMKIPGGGLRGSWFVHASGPAANDLLEAIVPNIVADMAGDLGWKKKPVAEAVKPVVPAEPMKAEVPTEPVKAVVAASDSEAPKPAEPDTAQTATR